MKKLLFLTLGALLNSSLESYAMNTEANHAIHTDVIKISPADVLRERLYKRGLKKFVDNSDIVDSLADQEKVPYEVLLSICFSIRGYIQLVTQREPGKGKGVGPAMETNTAIMLEAVLEEHSGALKALEKDGSYKSAHSSPERIAFLSQWLDLNTPEF